MPARISPDQRFAYFSNPQEFAAAMAAYAGTGPYPAMEPSIPGGPNSTLPPPAVPAGGPPVGPQRAVGPPPVGPGAAMGPPSGGGANNRPWWMNHSNEALMQMVRQNPSLRSSLPASVIMGFPNEFFLQNSSFQDMLDPGRRATFGTGALPPAAGSSGPAAPPGVPTRDAEAGWIQHNPGGAPTLMQPGQGASPLTPRVSQAIQGQPLAPLRTLGNLPFFSAQSLANMPASERESLGVLANKTGNRAEDFFEWSRRLSAQAGGGGGGGGYAGAPRRR